MDLLHATRVAMNVVDDGWGENVIAAAFLHDAIEDGDLTFDEIKRETNINVAYLVRGVTRRADENYAAYINRIAQDPTLAAIKVADLRDNINRTDDLHSSLLPRYQKALRSLLRKVKSE